MESQSTTLLNDVRQQCRVMASVYQIQDPQTNLCSELIHEYYMPLMVEWLRLTVTVGGSTKPYLVL
jgi:hypothetical protein